MFSKFKHKPLIWPNGKKFAFTVFDDTDCATIENIGPVYDLLSKLNIRTTKSVWVYPTKNPANDNYRAKTLQNPSYLKFIRRLRQQGFEIALHNVSANSTRREKIIAGLETFKQTLGFYPQSHCNHASNHDNLYWKRDRLNTRFLKYIMQCLKYKTVSAGHLKNSPYFWGDVCQKQIRYVRNFTFKKINILNINPTIPYYDPRKPLVQNWFSSADGADVRKFNKLISLRNQEQLENEGGLCIIYTHFAFGFVKNGQVNPKTEKLLIELSKRNGWFTPVAHLLDYLRTRQKNHIIPLTELKQMEYRWFAEKILEKFLKHKL